MKEGNSHLKIPVCDPAQLNRVRVRFPWQQESQRSPWIELSQGHAGAGLGNHWIPETGTEVLVGFKGGSAEMPYVLSSLFSGSQKSGYHIPGNDLKSMHTRSGTKRIVNDAEGSILEEDAAGSYIKLNGEGNIHVNAVKNMNFTIGQDFTIQVGRNMRTVVDGSKSQI